MCIRGVEIDPWALGFVPDHYKTQEMCIRGVEVDPSFLQYVPDMFVTQEMCDKAVENIHGYWNTSLIGLCHNNN